MPARSRRDAPVMGLRRRDEPAGGAAGRVPRIADHVHPSPRPERGELRVVAKILQN